MAKKGGKSALITPESYGVQVRSASGMPFVPLQSADPPMNSDERAITVPQFTAMKAAGQKITMLTAYDYATAQFVDGAGIEGILVGDSLSMVVQGHANTLPVTLEEMIYHAEMVGRAVQHALLVVDMPFPSFHLGVYRAIESAGGS